MFDEDYFDLGVFDNRATPVFSDLVFDSAVFDTDSSAIALQGFVGGSWVPGVLKRWDNGSWVPANLKVRIGTSWVTTL